eukprot:6203461-Pleurochrysis_carterae.AAC.2
MRAIASYDSPVTLTQPPAPSRSLAQSPFSRRPYAGERGISRCGDRDGAWSCTRKASGPRAAAGRDKS